MPHSRRTEPWALPRADSPPENLVAECATRLRSAGVLDALRLLNGRTRFRFTGLYCVDPPVLRNLYLFDRENPGLDVSGEVVPLADTYCGITSGTNAAFATDDAPRDDRLRSHAARESVLSYAGVPVRLESGCAGGTLCHFDVRPRLLPAAELHALQATAPLFARWVLKAGT